ENRYKPTIQYLYESHSVQPSIGCQGAAEPRRGKGTTMKIITLAALVMAALSITATTALAGTPPVSTGKQACKASGRAVVNVHFTYTSPDSGLGGNNWANDTINRQLQIWQVDGGYCASVTDHGRFVTVDGASPGNTSQVRAGITGKMKGGYTTTLLTGTLDPSMPTRGDLGS